MALNSKYQIKIGDFGFILARDVRLNRHLYARDEAPAFVNKFSSGEPNYRDASFFSHFVQLDFLNGLGQEFFDDPSRFYYSEGVDTTKLQELTLEKRFSSAGQLAAGIYGKAQVAWRASASSYFGDGRDGALTISVDTTDAPIDSTASGSSGSTTLTATNASFAAGQKILIHQTVGTNAGSWLLTEILSYSAGTITTKDPLNVDYSSSGSNKAQVLVVKQYSAVTVDATKTLTAKAWNNANGVGGILAFMCSGTITVNGTITATGKGFAGGTAHTSAVPGYQGNSSTGVGTQSTSANGSGGGGGDDGDGASAGGGAGGGHGAAGTNGSAGARPGGTGGSTDGNASLTDLNFGGAGGAGGSRSGQGANGGAGGNSGGIVFLIGKTLTMGGSSAISNAGSNGSNATGTSAGGGGGGAGGAILLKVQTATLGTTLITAAAGSAGSGSGGGNGGAGAVGRIHIDYLTSYTGTTTPTIDATQDGTLTDTPIASSYTHLVGASNGKIYSWDGASTYTELFDTRRLEWFDTTSAGDADKVVGDTGGTETAHAQSFQVDANCKMKAIQVYLKKNAGTPGDITVRIETNNAGVPSGTLVDATNGSATIPAFTTTSYGWVTVEFPAAFALTGSTTYWIVLKTAAASNDNNYAWRVDTSSPSYSAGNMASSTNGGSTWSAQTGWDAMFRLLGASTHVNCAIASDITATMKAYFGTGDPSETNNGDARVYSYDGTNFALVKIFNDTNESSVNAMIEYGSTRTVYFGLGHKAKVYSTTNMTSFTLAKTIIEPRNPGHVLAMAVYGGVLYVGGGYPEQLYGNNTQYSGFLYSFDEYDWVQVGTFEHTVVTCLESFDTLLFIGTINKRIYVFNTATIEKLFEFEQDMQITAMSKWNDKLAIATAPRPGASVSTHEGVYIFDRNGIHKAYYVASRSWYSLFVLNNNLMGANDDGYMYVSSNTTYLDSGWVQTSYFEAQLPSIDKLLREVIVQHDALPADTSIQIHYRFSEDASWTSLGTSSTDNDTEETFTFPVATYAKKVSFKITLATSNTANTPTFKKLIMKYQLAPDFKYIWKMTVVCPDDMVWLDGTQPISTMSAGCTANDTSLILVDADGFPDPNGSTFQASVVDSTGTVIDTFTYTGKTGDTLTGIPSSGSLALGTHAAGTRVEVKGRDLHKNLLNLKQTKKFYTFTDLDGNTYTTYFHSFQTDGWAIDVSAGKDVLENEVPITLLEA